MAPTTGRRGPVMFTSGFPEKKKKMKAEKKKMTKAKKMTAKAKQKKKKKKNDDEEEGPREESAPVTIPLGYRGTPTVKRDTRCCEAGHQKLPPR